MLKYSFYQTPKCEKRMIMIELFAFKVSTPRLERLATLGMLQINKFQLSSMQGFIKKMSYLALIQLSSA